MSFVIVIVAAITTTTLLYSDYIIPKVLPIRILLHQYYEYVHGHR